MKKFRIAFRLEGKRVNAYLAEPDTMVDAVQIASFDVDLLRAPETWVEYRALVVHALQRGGVDFEYTEQPAPEHERAGQA